MGKLGGTLNTNWESCNSSWRVLCTHCAKYTSTSYQSYDCPDKNSLQGNHWVKSFSCKVNERCFMSFITKVCTVNMRVRTVLHWVVLWSRACNECNTNSATIAVTFSMYRYQHDMIQSSMNDLRRKAISLPNADHLLIWKYLYISRLDRGFACQKCVTRCTTLCMHRVHHQCSSNRGNFFALRWCHNGRDSVSNHRPHGCLLNRLFRRRSKKTSKLRRTGLCAGNSPGTPRTNGQ